MSKIDVAIMSFISLLIGVLLFIMSFVSYGVGQTDGIMSCNKEVTAYKQAACAYAKDAGRELPEWCKK